MDTGVDTIVVRQSPGYSAVEWCGVRAVRAWRVRGGRLEQAVVPREHVACSLSRALSPSLSPSQSLSLFLPRGADSPNHKVLPRQQRAWNSSH